MPGPVGPAMPGFRKCLALGKVFRESLLSRTCFTHSLAEFFRLEGETPPKTHFCHYVTKKSVHSSRSHGEGSMTICHVMLVTVAVSSGQPVLCASVYRYRKTTCSQWLCETLLGNCDSGFYPKSFLPAGGPSPHPKHSPPPPPLPTYNAEKLHFLCEPRVEGG